MNHISKSFDDMLVLSNLNFCAQKGEIHGIIGGNAAGKSTLAEILAGITQPDSGEVLLDGKTVRLKTRSDSQKAGICMAFHQIELFPDLTIFENIALGKENSMYGRRVFMPSRKQMVKEAQSVMDELGLCLDPHQKVTGLSEGERLLIQLARTVIGNPQIIILDEVTALLTSYEIENVFRLLHRLRAEGKCILVISHQIEYLLGHCDRISILKDGAI
ncbi:MAG: ATP-binding cassette domain-containing protein, partial [Christensenella sp.]|uniref:ATP-binding cassette domain-containing protein n=1 Tax=Christensenella sp. TaxID=1935934 RepID=UPI002B1F8298